MTRAIESTLVPMTHGIAYETMLPLFPYYSFFGNLAFPKDSNKHLGFVLANLHQ